MQALTEFLPISSSAHLLLFQRWLGMEEPGALLVAVLHLGTLGSLLVFFLPEIRGLLRWERRRYVFFLVLGTLPLVVMAGLTHGGLEALFSSVRLASSLLFVTGALLVAASFFGQRGDKELGPGRALLIGVAQAAAVFPGLSRSGATVSTGLLLGLAPMEAFNFSFLLGVPAFIGAGILAFWHGQPSGESAVGLALSALVAFLMGLLALRFFRRFLLSRRLWPFAIYCAVLGVLGLVLA